MKVALFIIILLFPSIGKSDQSSQINLLLINCNGKIYRAIDSEKNIIGDFEIGDAIRGFLFEDSYFSIRIDEIIETNLITKNHCVIYNSENQPRNDGTIFRINYIDNQKILFTTAKRVKQLKKKPYYVYRMFQLDRISKTLSRIPLRSPSSTMATAFKDNIYYTGQKGFIYILNKKGTSSLGYKGISPSISPNGKQIAYFKSNFFFYSLYVRDLTTGKILFKKHFLLSMPDFEIIRWSQNNNFIAVTERSDTQRTPLYVFDVSKDRKVAEFKKSTACNWYFYDSPVPVK